MRISSELTASFHELPDAPDADTRRKNERAIACTRILDSVKKMLEERNQRLAVCANLLGLADRELIALYPRSLLEWKVQTVQDDLRELVEPPKERVARLQDLDTVEDRDARWEDQSRLAVKEAMRYRHEKAEEAYSQDDLQASRLRRVLAAMFVAWLSLVVAIPTVSTVQLSADGSEVVWPVWQFGAEWVDLAAAAVGLSVIGAVGGMMSGMFALRDMKAVPSEFRTSMLRLWLRPMTGAVAAVTLYLFISANVISGVEVANAGVYVVVAFLAGFSERYFLKSVHEWAAAQPDPTGQSGARSRRARRVCGSPPAGATPA